MLRDLHLCCLCGKTTGQLQIRLVRASGLGWAEWWVVLVHTYIANPFGHVVHWTIWHWSAEHSPLFQHEMESQERIPLKMADSQSCRYWAILKMVCLLRERRPRPAFSLLKRQSEHNSAPLNTLKETRINCSWVWLLLNMHGYFVQSYVVTRNRLK